MRFLLGKIIFVVCGIAAIIVGIFVYNTGNKLKKVCTQEVTAKVVAMETEEVSTDDEWYTEYTPTYEFTYEGETYTVRGEASRTRDYTKDQEVTIKINPDNPNQILVGSGVPIFVPIIFIAFGVIFILGGIFGKPRRA